MSYISVNKQRALDAIEECVEKIKAERADRNWEKVQKFRKTYVETNLFCTESWFRDPENWDVETIRKFLTERVSLFGSYPDLYPYPSRYGKKKMNKLNELTKALVAHQDSNAFLSVEDFKLISDEYLDNNV